jgi:CRP-like cAMP-binding protein
MSDPLGTVFDEPLGAGFEEPEDLGGAFPRLGPEQRARSRAAGDVRTVQSGEFLFREGDAGYDFFLVESGVVAIVQGYGHENRIVAVHGPRSAEASGSGSGRSPA